MISSIFQILSDTFSKFLVTDFFGLVSGSLLNIPVVYTDLCVVSIPEIEGIFAINSRKILKAKLLKELSAIKTEKSTLFGREVIFIYYETSCIPIKIKFIFNPEELKFNGDCSIPLTVQLKIPEPILDRFSGDVVDIPTIY
ncbi:hypothetical protein H8356DRAFT_1427820 [Neocallimastix lanati (nom. inval.)]|nr:hypothetical protein H8356DRAFT_1427820 [Neocallimastix sp. JGI-2020a]